MSFETFWTCYPRKKAKGDAEKAWRQVGGERHLGAILAALEWQRREWTDPKFTPYPASYLRAKRWEDQPDVQASDIDSTLDILKGTGTNGLDRGRSQETVRSPEARGLSYPREVEQRGDGDLHRKQRPLLD